MRGRKTRPWVLVFLLVAVMLLSFFDRGNLSVAAPVLAPDLGITPEELGRLFSAFFFTYALFQVGVGWLCDRIDVKWVYASGFLVWSAATLGTAATTGFTGLLLMRLLLGVGESVTYPATARILAAVIPERRRGLANSLVDAFGARIGPALGIVCGAWLVADRGWRALFLILGGAGLLWLVPWIALAPRLGFVPEKAAAVPKVGWRELLARRAFWGTCGGLMGANYAWYFLLTWLPSYLVGERGFSLKSMGVIGSFPFLIMVVPSLAGGVVADWLVSHGRSPVRVRKSFLAAGLLLTAMLLPLTIVPRIELALAALFAACFTLGVYASNLFALTQSLAGPEASGRWTGLQNACGNIPGMVAPWVTGWIVQTTGRFSAAFVAAGVSCLIGSACFGLLVREADRLGTDGRPDVAA
jgi:MFS family permease